MMQMTPAQMAQMGRAAFEMRLVGLIRECYPQQCAALDDGQLRAAIAPQIARAKGYGLTDERSVATFVNAAWLLGDRFDERIPAMAQVLRAPDLNAKTKAKAVDDFQRVVFHSLRETPEAKIQVGP